MKIVITAATEMELTTAKKVVATLKTKHKIVFHVSGVGLLQTTVSLMKMITKEKPMLVIQIGIAGSFKTNIKLGKVVLVQKDTIIDGVEENGEWKDLFDMKWIAANTSPFNKKWLPNSGMKNFEFPKNSCVTGITVTEITTNAKRMEQFVAKYNPAIESMEGAALHYVCSDAKVGFLQLRAISNYVGERDKSKWLIKESLDNLSNSLLAILQAV